MIKLTCQWKLKDGNIKSPFKWWKGARCHDKIQLWILENQCSMRKYFTLLTFQQEAEEEGVEGLHGIIQVTKPNQVVNYQEMAFHEKIVHHQIWQIIWRWKFWQILEQWLIAVMQTRWSPVAIMVDKVADKTMAHNQKQGRKVQRMVKTTWIRISGMQFLQLAQKHAQDISKFQEWQQSKARRNTFRQLGICPTWNNNNKSPYF